MFGMGTGGSSLLSPPDFSLLEVVPSKLNNAKYDSISYSFLNLSWSSPRSISTGQLNTLLHLHLRPINHVVCMGPYYLVVWEILS